MRSGATRVVRDNRDDHSRVVWGPTWSPDSRRIAFVSTQAPAHAWNLHAVHADGSDFQELTATAAHDASPAWSPDGTSIAYVTRDGPNTSIVNLIAAEGGASRELFPVGPYISGLDWWGLELLDLEAPGKRPLAWGWLKQTQAGPNGR